MKIILEIEGNFRHFHQNKYFDEFFIEKGFENHSKSISSFSNQTVFEDYLQKFKEIPSQNSFKTYCSLENIQEIVWFYQGNLTELFTKFEFLSKSLIKDQFLSLKYQFFLENHCFDFFSNDDRLPLSTFPKELQQKKVAEILSLDKQTKITVKYAGFI